MLPVVFDVARRVCVKAKWKVGVAVALAMNKNVVRAWLLRGSTVILMLGQSVAREECCEKRVPLAVTKDVKVTRPMLRVTTSLDKLKRLCSTSKMIRTESIDSAFLVRSDMDISQGYH